MVFLIIYVDFYFYIVDHHGFSVSRCAWFFSLIFTKDCSCICVADLMNFYAFDLHLNCLSYTVCPKKSEPLNILQQQPQICSDLNKILHTRGDFCYKHYYVVSYKSALTLLKYEFFK